jgi:hypothetical protein
MRHDLPEVPGVLSAADVLDTAATIAELQLPSGMIPWFAGGHCDPWNHVETAMALDVAGLHAEAERAYAWLRHVQRPDGSWHAYYLADSIEDPKLDTNVCAYVAAGIWHHWLLTGDLAFVEAMWATVERAIDWVLDLQTPRGEIVWARHVDGRPWSYALLTGSSSIFHSLGCAVRLGELVGQERPDWELSAVNLASVIRTQPDAFAPKHRWAMDWYYPVLAGVLTGKAAADRLASKWDTFVLEGLGVRCVSNEPWITASETSECAIAHAATGDLDTAVALLSWTARHRHDDGSYWTGIVYPGRVHFPDGERTAYTGAAVILAADTISRASPASGLFCGEGLLQLPEDELVHELEDPTRE